MARSDAGSSSKGTYELPAIFAALRSDLIDAQNELRGSDKQPLLKVTEVEIELAFTLEGERKVGGGLNLRFFGVGFGGKAEIGRTEGTTHRIKISLGPAGKDDLGVLGQLPPPAPRKRARA